MNILVTGAGGALGGHLVKRLLADGHGVRAVDIKPLDDWWQLFPEAANIQADLSLIGECKYVVNGADRIFNLAANMGGMGFIMSHRADCMQSVLINTHLLQAAVAARVKRYWFASSACVYAASKQDTPDAGYTLLKEADAWPQEAEAGYGEEKSFAEQMCRYFAQDYGIETRIGRLHNVYATYSTWTGGREKAPAALCRKVAEAKLRGEDSIEIWGDGTKTRSFLYVDDFVEGALRIMDSDYPDPVNLGSSEVVTINELADVACAIAGVQLKYRYNINAPQGVQGRGSNNTLLKQVTGGWLPKISLVNGMSVLYPWIEERVKCASVDADKKQSEEIGS